MFSDNKRMFLIWNILCINPSGDLICYKMMNLSSVKNIFLVSLFIVYVIGQKNWRKVYLEDPKGILRGERRQIISEVAEFTDLGDEYENGSIWPKPQNEERSDKYITFNPKNFKFVLVNDGKNEGSYDIIVNALSRYHELTFSNKKDFHADDDLDISTELKVDIKDLKETLSIDSNESYKLTIESPTCTLKAKSVWGALRGLESFSQAVHKNGNSYRASKLKINDFPRYKFRGFLIDTSRHYLPVSKIFQILDALAYSKFNILHWHIVDEPSFPYVSKKFPELHKEGAFNAKTHIYTPAVVKDVIEYAKFRGIRVMPEFDTPGHAHSWKGIPDLLTKCYDSKVQEKAYQDLGPMDVTKNKTYTFLSKFFKEVAAVFPDEYIHLGGDEVDSTCWLSNPDIKKWLKTRFKEKLKDTEGGSILHTYFLNKLISIITKLNKKYVVWQDVFDDGVDIGHDAIVNVWQKEWQGELQKVTGSGYKAILSSPWYLNYIRYALDWPKLYEVDPDDVLEAESSQNLVIGGSATMWGEYVDATNIIQRSFGRAFAVAERLWSSKNTRDIKSALKRIWEHRCRYVDRGIPAEPVTRAMFCRKEYGQSISGLSMRP